MPYLKIHFDYFIDMWFSNSLFYPMFVINVCYLLIHSCRCISIPSDIILVFFYENPRFTIIHNITSPYSWHNLIPNISFVKTRIVRWLTIHSPNHKEKNLFSKIECIAQGDGSTGRRCVWTNRTSGRQRWGNMTRTSALVGKRIRRG